LKIEGGQTNLTEFFEGSVGSGTFAPRRKVAHRSKRLSKAMDNLRKQDHSDDDVQEISPRKMPTKRKRPSEVIKIESDEEVEVGPGKDGSVEGDSSSDDDNFERTRGGRNTTSTRETSRKQPKKESKSARGRKVIKV
jgi:hypothetical protein